jgi:ankyrin repeat protein
MNQLYSQLFDAVKKKSSAALKESMSLEADPNCIGPDGIPLLHVASETGDIECLEIILKHYNVNLNITDLNGNSALHVAAKLNNVEIIKVLLNFGVNPNLTNNSGKRAADLATIPSCKNLLTGTAPILI